VPEAPRVAVGQEAEDVLEPVLIGAGVIVLVSAAGSAVRLARRWTVSGVVRIVTRVLDERYLPVGPRSLPPRPVPRFGALDGMEEFRRGGRAER
jgi:hypothetical protein